MGFNQVKFFFKNKKDGIRCKQREQETLKKLTGMFRTSLSLLIWINHNINAINKNDKNTVLARTVTRNTKGIRVMGSSDYEYVRYVMRHIEEWN